MNAYWYFFATLPGLRFGASPPFSSSEFLSLCRTHLSSEDYSIVESSTSSVLKSERNATSASNLVRQYISWERSLRNELSRLRARSFGKNEEEFIRNTELSGEGTRTALNVFSVDDPLQAELFLERQRWNALEQMASGSDFRLDAIVAYRIKLDILERIGKYKGEIGSANYKSLYEEILGRNSMGDNA